LGAYSLKVPLFIMRYWLIPAIQNKEQSADGKYLNDEATLLSTFP
jgi:hypothetical protein